MKQELEDSFLRELVKYLLPLSLFGFLFSVIDGKRTNFFESEPLDELHPHIYNCTECKVKVAWGDNFCRACGIEFSASMCAQMKDEITLLTKENFPSLAFLILAVTFLLAIAFSAFD